MFVFNPDYTFEWPVKVDHPGGEKQEFTGIFRQPEDEKDIFERVTADDLPGMIEAAKARIARYWIGWRGIQVVGGGELAFSEENRDRLLKNRAIRLGVDRALHEALVGDREKN
ncbi:hypothetical protein M3484_05045 [Pseudomonas sp. GX19020]|uniref:hypothetical protein n=1 Tax=Pseudomonas sp. GX19020 TaxID=2942277 RepID=UPI0020188E48|nr:hypothetical protein [Pseudomonas sp. GX19020]MCL4065928.1 hypothetical protein [Pseudomonas sp. GX19020]